MMTPSELREYEFKGAGRNAYKSDDVDMFFGEVAVAYEKLFRENAELVKRVSLLADRLEQFKHDEDQIKQAVLGAQKAADIIVKEAEMSVEDSKVEAEAILAAAKGEADIIKSDAEKQAIADSDLLLSIARDKAEEIINKAKEEAHGILIEANDSAKDTVGAATRTITSESIHYEMLKKEVSEFRASILAQYKAHIEMISKLPELAVDQANKQLDEENSVTDNAVEGVIEEIQSVDPENDIIEYIDSSDDENEFAMPDFSGDEEDGELVVKTTLPFDFFETNEELEFIQDDVEDSESDYDSAEDCDELSGIVDSIDDEAGEELDVTGVELEAETDVDDETEVNDEPGFDNANNEENTKENSDIPISRGFTVNTASLSVDDVSDDDVSDEKSSIFDSFATIEDDEDDDDEEEPKKKFGIFRRKK